MEFCGVREQFGFTNRPQSKLPMLDPTWYFDGDLPGLSDATVDATIQAALSTWSKRCRPVWSKAATMASATLKIITTRIDGPLNILADCEFPYPGMRQILMRLDMEKFTTAFNPGPNYLGLPHVVAHEGGHAMGVFHLADDSTPDLMNARYNARIWEPQDDDAAIVLQLYGPPLAIIPQPTPPIPGMKSINVNVEQDGKKWSGSIPRI